jgi:hypothetical protein
MPDLIKNIIPEVIEKLSGGNPEWQSSLIRAWEAATDNKAKKHARIAGFRKGKLLVNVDSPVWMFQLSFKKPELLRKLQKDFPDLSAISFRIGNIQ